MGFERVLHVVWLAFAAAVIIRNNIQKNESNSTSGWQSRSRVEECVADGEPANVVR